MRSEQGWKEMFQADNEIQEPDFDKMWVNIQTMSRKKILPMKPIAVFATGILSLMLFVGSISNADSFTKIINLTMGNEEIEIINERNIAEDKEAPEDVQEHMKEASREEVSDLLGVNVVAPSYLPEGYVLGGENGITATPNYNEEGKLINVIENVAYHFIYKPKGIEKVDFDALIYLDYFKIEKRIKGMNISLPRENPEYIELFGYKGIKYNNGLLIMKDLEEHLVVIELRVPAEISYDETVKIMESVIKNL